MGSGFQGKTDEYRWPVVDTREPKGVRVPVGYVTILFSEHADGTKTRRLMFSNVDGVNFQSFGVEMLDIFYDAAQAALKEMGLRSSALPGDRPVAGDIVR